MRQRHGGLVSDQRQRQWKPGDEANGYRLDEHSDVLNQNTAEGIRSTSTNPRLHSFLDLAVAGTVAIQFLREPGPCDARPRKLTADELGHPLRADAEHLCDVAAGQAGVLEVVDGVA